MVVGLFAALLALEGALIRLPEFFDDAFCGFD